MMTFRLGLRAEDCAPVRVLPTARLLPTTGRIIRPEATYDVEKVKGTELYLARHPDGRYFRAFPVY